MPFVAVSPRPSVSTSEGDVEGEERERGRGRIPIHPRGWHRAALAGQALKRVRPSALP